ncbi:MAG: hypothetical protein MHM6MM_005041 [Cercozoa sp. M6MM]
MKLLLAVTLFASAAEVLASVTREATETVARPQKPVETPQKPVTIPQQPPESDEPPTKRPRVEAPTPAAETLEGTKSTEAETSGAPTSQSSWWGARWFSGWWKRDTSGKTEGEAVECLADSTNPTGTCRGQSLGEPAKLQRTDTELVEETQEGSKQPAPSPSEQPQAAETP